MPVVMKAIHPKKMKQDAVRLQLLNTMRQVERGITKDMKATTATWKHKPVIQSERTLTGPGPIVTVWTDDEVYGYVDKGTKPHLIWAGFYTGKSGAKVLRFNGTFTAKTVPGVLGSRAGSSGPPVVMTPYVRHPGTKPRRFTKTIEKKWQKEFVRIVRESMTKAAQASGHQMP